MLYKKYRNLCAQCIVRDAIVYHAILRMGKVVSVMQSAIVHEGVRDAIVYHAIFRIGKAVAAMQIVIVQSTIEC